MKYLKTYNKLNEGLRDKMSPKTKEEITDSIEKLPLDELLNMLQYEWVSKMGNEPGSGKVFSSFVKGVIGRDIWEEIKKTYVNSEYKNDDLIELDMRFDYSPSNIIFNSNLSKEDVIKILIKLQDIKNDN